MISHITQKVTHSAAVSSHRWHLVPVFSQLKAGIMPAWHQPSLLLKIQSEILPTLSTGRSHHPLGSKCMKQGWFGTAEKERHPLPAESSPPADREPPHSLPLNSAQG